jgi:23S rRNA (cytidine1920-2'-O)/16S rRNA (cytidine1409-2'-O)-methyltransferase
LNSALIMRLDQILVAQNKFESRTKAQVAIKSGQICLANGKVIKKPSFDLDQETELIVKDRDPYVSRGAYKLLKAIEVFELNYLDKTVLDIGASTGGFTQVALNEGARQVFALDVGSKQLAQSLVEDSRVVVIENYNFRYAKTEDFPREKFDIIQCDVSFISLVHIIPQAAKIMKHGAKAVFLIKPQFEAGKEHIAKNGVVKDHSVYQTVIQKIITVLKEKGLAVEGLTYSPIKGQHGNTEFLVSSVKTDKDVTTYSQEQIKKIIRAAKQNLSS